MHLVIYHADCTDGFTAAWVAWLKHGRDATYVPARYGAPPPDVAGLGVLVLDFSYPRDVLLEMQRDAASIKVLDHHKTAEKELAGLPFCTFDSERSGAGLAWDELFPGERRPQVVEYVEDRDLWRWELPNSREINAYVSSYSFNFETWSGVENMLTLFGSGAAQEGSAILRAQERRVRSRAGEAARMTFEGFVVPVVNCTDSMSEVLNELAKDAPFAVGWFQRQDGQFVYSLRSVGDFDVSEIAGRHGGGGHKNAAGFTLPFLFDEIRFRFQSATWEREQVQTK